MILRAENVSKTFTVEQNKIEVLKNINFEIRDGEKIAIVGPSGSGKSTFLNVLSGLDSVTEGNVFLDDCNISKLGSKEMTKCRLENFGFVFQAYHLISTLNVLDNIMIPLLARKEEIEIPQILELCKVLSISDRINHFPHQLSGGEMQRVCIARAIASKPKIIFSDEATGNLDEKNSKTVMELLCNCCKMNNVALLYVTHDMSLVKYADKVARLDKAEGVRFV